MKNKLKIKHKNNKSNRFLYSKLFLVLSIIMFLFLIILVVFEYVNFTSIERIFLKPKLVELNDECSLIMGNLVHQIRDEDDCNIRCNNQCNLLGLNYKSIEFTKNQNSCNVCNCYCK